MRKNDPQGLAFSHLSENESLPSSRAAEEDSLHAWFGKFIVAEDLDREVDAKRVLSGDTDLGLYTENYKAAVKAAVEWAGQASNEKCLRMLSCPFTRLYCLTLSRLPSHYRGGWELKQVGLTARQKRDMGVSI